MDRFKLLPQERDLLLQCVTEVRKVLQQRNGGLFIPWGIEPAQAAESDIHVMDDEELLYQLELAVAILSDPRLPDTSG